MSPRVVVGVDGSDHSRHALDHAFEAARRIGATVTVVHAYRVPTPAAIYGAPQVTTPSRDDVERAARDLLDRTIGTRPADLDIECIAAPGAPAEVLVRLAAGADLLVVGSRGRGGFSQLLLGSTSHQVVTHATCPVLVVPARLDE